MEACRMTSSQPAVSKSASSASDRSIFLTGATGYVGGSYLQILLSLPQTAKKITTLVRSEDKAKLLEKLPGVEAVVGSFDDLDLLTRLAAEHDVTIETADSDNPELMDALLKGFEKRHAQGLKTDFIHVSGTGTLVDEAKGEYPTDTIYTDGEPKSPNVKHISALPESAFHRKIDLAIVAADKKGWCNSYIILPGTIWGDAQGEIFDKGIANPHSKQIPQQAQASIDRGKAGMVGKGLNVWPHVHIEDVASQFETVYTASLDGKAEHGEKGYFFATSGEYRLLEATQAIGETLAKNGLSKTADVDSFSEDEITKIYSALEKIGGSKYYSGTNSRAESAQATALGWSPKHTSVEEFYKYCRDETERLGKQSK